LFKDQRVRVAILEVHETASYANFTTLLSVYQSILSFNYSIKPLNCKDKKGKLSKNLIWTNNNITDLKTYLSLPDGDKKKCPDVQLELLI
jgi:hypothetical protein